MLLKTVTGISRKTLKRGSSLVESSKKSTNSARVCPFPHLFSLLQDMASAQSSVSEAELAICRLVEETSGHETFKYLGPGCLASFESVEFLHSFGTPNSNYFLVASNQVLTKSHLCAIEKQDKARSNGRKPSVKIVAEFPGSKDRGSLERKPLSDLYRSLEDDVFEFNGIIYVALTKLKKGSFLLASIQYFRVGFESAEVFSFLWRKDFNSTAFSRVMSQDFRITSYAARKKNVSSKKVNLRRVRNHWEQSL